MRTKIHSFDPAEHLGTPEVQAAYVFAALKAGDPVFIADGLGVVARALGMFRFARGTDPI